MNENRFYTGLGNGISKIYANDADGALKAFSEVIKMESDIPLDKRLALAFHLRGNVYSQLGNYADGITDRKKAMEIDPEYENLYNNLGNNFAEIDRKIIENMSIASEENFQKVFSEFSNVHHALKWIKDYLSAESRPKKSVESKLIQRGPKGESVKILIRNIIETEFKERVKKGETINGGIRRKILDILSNRNNITIDDRQLRSYLSRLEYTNQRENGPDDVHVYSIGKIN